MYLLGCIRKWHVPDAILLLRRDIAVFIFVDYVYVLLEIPTGLRSFFDGYEQPLKRPNQLSSERTSVERIGVPFKAY